MLFYAKSMELLQILFFFSREVKTRIRFCWNPFCMDIQVKAVSAFFIYPFPETLILSSPFLIALVFLRFYHLQFHVLLSDHSEPWILQN